MKPNPKTLAFAVLFVFAASTLITAAHASAQGAAPSTPQFSLTVVDNSQYVPRTYTVDPNTGQSVASGDYTIESITVELRIQNQPYSQVTLPDGNATQLRYLARFKGHFADWGSSSNEATLTQSWDGETVFTYFKGLGSEHCESWQVLPDVDDAQVDFQVKAQVGYYHQCYPEYGGVFPVTSFVVLSESGWSSTQTVTLAGSSEVTPQPTYTQPPAIVPDCTEAPAAVEPPEQNLGYNFNGALNSMSSYLLGIDSKTAFQAIILSIVLMLIAMLTVAFVSASLKPQNPPPPPP